MKEQELLKITFTKLYEEIDDVTYDCGHILAKLYGSHLITEERRRSIENKQETTEKNRCLIDALLKGVHNIHQFKKVLEMFYSEREFYEVAESMKVVYCVLKNEEKIMKTLNFNNLFMCLRKQKFFTKHEEATLLKKKKEIQEIIEILKDKDMHSFKIFLSCLKELKQDLVTTVISSSDKYLTPLLDKFKQFLQKRYINGSFTQMSEVDFKLPISDDINIALIEISEEDHKKESTFFDYYSLLLKQEAGYSRQFLDSYSDIIVENCKVILIQGYPGSGKTFLAKTMCKKWARGELLQTFSFVIFLQLRDIEVANAKTLDELIELYMGSLTNTIMDEIYERNGQDSLIILEGWDELPECKQHSCLFTRLISGDLLPEAVIVITSRPSAIRSLQYNCIKRRIEILGFTEQQVGQNITCYFQKYTNASELIQKFYSELKRLPLLESSVFVPINLCIALYIFNRSSYHLPETFTDMYKNLVLIQLRRYQARRSHGSASINTLEDLPKDIEDMLLRLSKMAYDYLQKDLTLIFNETKIRQYCFYSRDVSLDSFDGMGLLQITNHRHFESVNKTYEFIHRTLQEVLAAWYLSRQNEVFQQKQLQNIFNRKDFEMVWIFYAGLTKFKTVSFKEILPRNSVLKIKMSSYKAFTWLMWTVVSNTFTRFHDICKILDVFFGGKQYSHNLSHYISREFQTTLIAAVMEAQNPQLCKEMCESYLFYGDTCWFCVPQSAATPQILSALSYCIAHSGKKWMIHSIGLDCSDADNLLKYLLTCNETFHCKCNKCKNFSGNADNGICVFDLNSSQSKVDGIVKLITTQKCLQWLVLSYCEQVNEQLVVELMVALEDNVSLKMLHLFGCNISSNSVKSISHMLKRNKALQWIGLKNNLTTLTEADIFLLLQTISDCNDTVHMLLLDNVFHTSDKIQEQLHIINTNRHWRGVNKLSLAVIDGLRYQENCQQIVSKFSFLNNESPSSVTTRDLESTKQVTVYLGEYSMRIVCPECDEEMNTITTKKISSITWVFILILIFTLWWPFCLLPLCVDECKDVYHSCSQCNAHLGVYRKM